MKNKSLIVVADPHLESVANDVDEMIGFVRTLKPDEHILIFLGDLFHVWVKPSRYHTDQENRLMNALADFRSKGGSVNLVVGNRDLFFKETNSTANDSRAPFNAIHLEFMALKSPDGLLMVHHGDTVNQKNKQYLMWRKLVRSALAEFIFKCIPPRKWKSILWSLEKRIKTTNKEFRNNFPDEQWAMFMEKVNQQHDPRLLLVGHFHPKTPIITEHNTTTGIVVPPWQGTQTYLAIDAQLNYQFRSHKSRVGAESRK